MSKSPQTEKLFIDGPVGQLEAMLETPGSGQVSGCAVVCHPHPQHGGTMHNKVAHTLARAFVAEGLATLRFNFRGTEASDGTFDHGVGELDDALAAIAWMRQKVVEGPIWLAGFSFGAAIAVRAAVVTEVAGLISVAPAISRFANGLQGQPRCPWMVVQGDEDELVDLSDTIDWLNGLEEGPELLVVAGGEHFLHGKLTIGREAVRDFVVEH